MIQKAKDFLHRHKKWEPLVFFVGGFAFDAFLLHRIDDPLMLVHQAVYLGLSALIIAWDLFTEAGRASVPKWFTKVWNYREGILHFLLGTLLNVYTIFYFKSGTFLSSVAFLILLMTLLILNEVRPPQISKHILRNSLFGLCLLSYMNIVISIAMASIGVMVFLIAVGAAALILTIFVWILKSKLNAEKVSREIRLPFMVVALVYTLLYLLKVLPPVPLSVKHLGIYHSIEKSEDTYKLGSTRSPWRFWESGDQTFIAHQGDTIICFVQVFSPTRFKDQLFVRWQFKDPRRGWTNSDAIPLNVVGGRADGYRGYTAKSNYQAGDWRVSVQTSDGREIGRIAFEVVLPLPEEDPPEFRYEFR